MIAINPIGVYYKGMLDILEMFPLKYVALVPILNAIGCFLKHETRLPNELIPFMLFAVSSALSIALRWLLTGEYGWIFWFDAVFMYGIVNSLKLTISAIGSYEAVRAFKFNGRRLEVQIMKRPFVRLLIATVLATVTSGLSFVFFGSSFLDVALRLSDGWVYGVFLIAYFDMLYKVAKHRERLTWIYWLMWGSVMASTVAFSIASSTANALLCRVSLIVAGVFGITAAAAVLVPYIKAKKEEKDKVEEFSPETYREQWVKLRPRLMKVDKAKQREILNGFLCFRLVGDSIYNDIDFTAPLLALKAADGESLILPVSKAVAYTDNGITAEEIKTATDYINGLVG